jgi:hypothetical protein
MILDPHADLGRRAWLPCPSCGTTPVYLLDYDINLIWVQCGSCLRRCWHDTGVGPETQPISSTSPDHNSKGSCPARGSVETLLMIAAPQDVVIPWGIRPYGRAHAHGAMREAERPLQATQLARDTAVLEQLLDDRL